MTDLQLEAGLKEVREAAFANGSLDCCISPEKVRASKATKSTYPPLRQTPKRPTLEDLDNQ